MIIVDTREKYPLWTENIIKKKLDVGDYSLEGFEDQICIERKSGADLLQTLGREHARFKREIARAMKLKYFAIVVEEPMISVYYNLHVNGDQSYMKGTTAIKILFTIHHKYKIPVYFCQNREETKILIKTLFDQYVINASK